MTASVPNPALAQLLKAITDPQVRGNASRLIQLSVDAVHDLTQLDDRIYQHYGEAGENKLVGDPVEAKSLLHQLAGDVLTGVRMLEKHLKSEASASPSEPSEAEADVDFDFDFGDGDAAAPATTEVDMDESDIDGAFDFLASPDEGLSSAERWKSVQSDLEALSYALGSQLRDFDERFTAAVDDKRYNQALRELNDVGSSLTDGVFALMSAIYKAYLDDVDRDNLLPGHKNTLAKALHVRRGLSHLRGLVQQHNQIVQDANADESSKETAFRGLSGMLSLFLDGDVFSIMRPADRVELKGFMGKFKDKSANAARFECEGLDKYLDSLAAVSQRDVLIKHDRDQVREIVGLLEAVQPLLDISPHGAADMVAQAFRLADSLFGLREPLDELLNEWTGLSRRGPLPAEEAFRMGKALDPLVRALG